MNPTEKLINLRSGELNTFLEGVLSLAASLKTLDFNYFRDEDLHPKVHSLLFDRGINREEIIEELMTTYLYELRYIDSVAINCCVNFYMSTKGGQNNVHSNQNRT